MSQGTSGAQNGLFGQSNTPGGLFGFGNNQTTQSQQPAQQPATGGLFGSSSGGGLFGNLKPEASSSNTGLTSN